MNTNKIQVENNDETPSQHVQIGGQLLAEMAMMGGGKREAIDALLLAAAELAVHDHGNVGRNLEAAQERLASMIGFAKEKHKDCIAELKERGIQHEDAVH